MSYEATAISKNTVCERMMGVYIPVREAQAVYLMFYFLKYFMAASVRERT
jgi:hypothetical protein